MLPELNPSAQEPVPAFHTDELPPSQRNRSTDHERCSPKALLRRLHEGDCELFYDLTKGFLQNVYAFVRSMVHDASMADDICQHTLLIAMQEVHHLRELQSLRSWVMQIAVNQVRMIWRPCQRHPTVSIDTLEDSDQPWLLPATLIDARETPLEAVAHVAHKELNRILRGGPAAAYPQLSLRFLATRYRTIQRSRSSSMPGISINCVRRDYCARG